MTAQARTYSSTDLVTLCGCTRRQLQWWDEHSVLSPGMVGHSRAWTADDVVRVRMIVKLRRMNVGLQRVRRVLKVVDPARLGNARYLVVGRKKVWVAESSCRVVELAEMGGGPVVVIDLAECAAGLRW